VTIAYGSLRRHVRALAVAVVCATAAYGCAGPMAPGGDPLQLSCPAPVTQYTPNGLAQVVNYPQPTITGGAPPVSTNCTPASGGTFAMGTSTVSCSGRDAQSHVAACTFNVTVAKTPELAATQFLAFGDSITEGKQSACPATALNDLAALRLDMLRIHADIEAGPSAYPRVLEGLLQARYALQTVNVVNEGCGGEQLNANVISPCGDGNAYQRLRDALRDHPQSRVLLLQEGTNDVAFHLPIADIVGVLRDMVREAKSRGIEPLVGALLPRVPGTCRAGPTEDIPVANEQIRAMASAEGVVFVDLYGGFGANFAQYIGVDGLHPSTAGYQKIAELFMASIQANLEVR